MSPAPVLPIVRTLRRHSAMLALSAALLPAACALFGREPAGPDAERRSETEYDLGRDTWLRRGDPRQGLSHALKSIELDDSNADAHHLSALIYLDLCQRPGRENCRLDEAQKHAATALKLRHDFREARNTLGVIQIHLKRPADAVLTLKPLTQDILYSTPENAWGNIGWAYLESGKLEEAIDALERSVAAQPRFCVGFYRLGLARSQKGQHEGAVEAFTQALSADPRCAALQDAYLGRAKANSALGRKAEASEDLARCQRLSKDTKTSKECDSLSQNLK